MHEAVRAGNIIRSQWPRDMRRHLNLFMGSGRAGACFDAYGLMNNGMRGEYLVSLSQTRLMHADHWHRGAWGLDYWLPVLKIAWEGEAPSEPNAYRQELDLYDGRLTTEMSWPGLRLTLISYFHPERRDLLAIDVRFEGRMPGLLIAPELDIHTQYDQHLTGDAKGLELDQGWWLGRITVGTADSVAGLRVISTEGAAELKPVADGLAVRFAGETGRHLLVVGMAGLGRREELCEDLKSIRAPEEFAAEAVQAWHRRWGDGFIHVPVPEYQALWARSMFYVLSSYAPDVRPPAPPMGWAGNCWPFGFPQDLSYLHPALLRLGHLDIARAWVESYRKDLETMRDYTRRIYGAEGTMWAWEYPIGPDSKLLTDGTPNWCQFEIHNAGYPARMAREASLHINDRQWTEEVAWPIVRESARFFGSVLRPEDDGTWGMHVIPSFGQDELGGTDAKNYLCSLWSARYALGTALKMADELGQSDPEFDRWRKILSDGLAFGRLLDPRTGLLVTCEGLLGTEQLGKEKHPVQLNPLIFLPLGKPDESVVRAYERRYELCAGVRENTYYGWTLAAYWLAASHMGDADGLLHELGQSLPGRYVDPDWIQIFETSGALGASYYVTSHGLYLQALNDALVSDYWGETQIGAACPDAWHTVRFGGMHTADGRVHSGVRSMGVWECGSVGAVE